MYSLLVSVPSGPPFQRTAALRAALEKALPGRWTFNGQKSLLPKGQIVEFLFDNEADAVFAVVAGYVEYVDVISCTPVPSRY